MIARFSANPLRTPPRLGTVSYDAWKAGDDEQGECDGACCAGRVLETYRDRVHREHGGHGSCADCRTCEDVLDREQAAYRAAHGGAR